MKWSYNAGDKEILYDFMAVISESGEFSVVTDNIVRGKGNLSASTNVTFPSRQGWFRLQSEDIDDYVYVRLNRNDTLELHLFDEQRCLGQYKGISNYCYKAVGTRYIPTAKANTTTNSTTATPGPTSIPIDVGMNNVYPPTFAHLFTFHFSYISEERQVII